MQVTTIGLDIAKNVFQVHGIDVAEKVVVRKQLRRSRVLEFFKALPPCGLRALSPRPQNARGGRACRRLVALGNTGLGPLGPPFGLCESRQHEHQRSANSLIEVPAVP